MLIIYNYSKCMEPNAHIINYLDLALTNITNNLSCKYEMFFLIKLTLKNMF